MAGNIKDPKLHHGHRKRMLSKYQRLGAAAFESHELLEMLLFYGIAGKNTNDTAHALIYDNKDLFHTLRADIPTLTKTKGIGPKNAMLVRLANDLVRQAELENLATVPFNNEFRIQRYITCWYSNQPPSTVMAMFLTKDLKLLETVTLSQGRKLRCQHYSEEILKHAQLPGAHYVILTHNHYDNCPNPSDNDLFLTSDARTVLASNGKSLINHYIVTDHDCIPIASC